MEKLIDDGWKKEFDVISKDGRKGVLWKYHWEITIGNYKQGADFYKIVCDDGGVELLVHVENGMISESRGMEWNKQNN